MGLEEAPVRRFKTLDSTSLEARRLAESGARGPLWIEAAHQSAGRGRGGRDWRAAPGNLYASLLFAPDCPPMQAGRLSFAAALAVADIAAMFAPAARIALKWPNDVLADGRKLAGILLESAGGAQIDWLIVGIGLNIAAAPEDTGQPTAALAQFCDSPPQTETVFAALRARMAYWLATGLEGFAPVRAAWLSKAARLGEIITARAPLQDYSGRFTGLDENGALLLQTAQGQCAIAAADIFFEER